MARSGLDYEADTVMHACRRGCERRYQNPGVAAQCCATQRRSPP